MKLESRDVRVMDRAKRAVKRKVLVKVKVHDPEGFSEEVLDALVKALEGKTKFYRVDEFEDFKGTKP